ncbi:hypothetical protein PGTUg99_028857 [Puccinia graminis f. sp. tritici]|uniref:Uncharacterized protein n=1 Tax=Puccinia graminis f. sp. tritici TaxID=56615 RepID=A0A5B0RG19_PUCGR|nr:hypothetical protein PGTUg99_028857 [Puccinia graminis f. sp. tritici]
MHARVPPFQDEPGLCILQTLSVLSVGPNTAADIGCQPAVDSRHFKGGYTTGAEKRFEAVKLTASKLFQLNVRGRRPGSRRRKLFETFQETFLIPFKKTASRPRANQTVFENVLDVVNLTEVEPKDDRNVTQNNRCPTD